MHEIGLAEPVR